MKMMICPGGISQGLVRPVTGRRNSTGQEKSPEGGQSRTAGAGAGKGRRALWENRPGKAIRNIHKKKGS